MPPAITNSIEQHIAITPSSCTHTTGVQLDMKRAHMPYDELSSDDESLACAGTTVEHNTGLILARVSDEQVVDTLQYLFQVFSGKARNVLWFALIAKTFQDHL